MLKTKFRFHPGYSDTCQSDPPWVLKEIFINLTGICNLRCTYCHAFFLGNEAHMKRQILDKILDQAVKFGQISIILTGGEPFLSPDFEYAIKGCFDRGISCKIATNGNFLTPESISMLVRYQVKSLQISLDTLNPEKYSKIKGVSPQIHTSLLKSIDRCVGTGKLHIAISSVADQDSRNELPEIIRYCHDHGIDTFTLYNVIPYGRAADLTQKMPESEYIACIDELISCFVRLPDHAGVELGVPWAYNSSLIKKWAECLKIHPVGCNAGKNSLTVLTNGDVVPCCCLEESPLSCGSLDTLSLIDLWNAPILQYFRGEVPVQSCGDCDDTHLCKYGCRTLGYLYTHTLTGSDQVCQYWRNDAP
jgi:radical SAM protein with 4Fe4S-binding SPASM domain